MKRNDEARRGKLIAATWNAFVNVTKEFPDRNGRTPYKEMYVVWVGEFEIFEEIVNSGEEFEKCRKLALELLVHLMNINRIT